MRSVIKSSDYNIYVSDTFDDLRRFLSQPKYKDSKIFVMVDENSLKYCFPILLMHVPALQTSSLIQIESGEEHKNIEICYNVWHALTEFGADRKSLFINLGGGVIGDMGGFIASAYKRGIDFINIPTTLLSQVDASVGGKVGVDLDTIKNQVGLFCNPKAVFVHPEFITTLNKRQMLSGFAEIIKHSLIADKSYWNKIKSIPEENSITFGKKLSEAIVHSIKIKNKIVLADPKEANLRKALNFGHTTGHAIESFSMKYDKKPLLHGEAIAIGMICEAYLSHKLCGLPEKQLGEIISFITSLYKHAPIDMASADEILDNMRNDKKNEKDKINFSLISTIGAVKLNQTCTVKEIKAALNYYRLEANKAVALN